MILGAQSRYFKDACKQEGSDGTHDLTDNDTGAVDAMITFMYKQYYSVPEGPCTADDRASLHINVSLLAGKYEIEALGTYAAARFSGLINECHGPATFTPWIVSIHTLTPASSSALRQACVDFAVKYAKRFYSGDAEFAAYIAATATIADFTTKVMQGFVRHPSLTVLRESERMVKCPRCAVRFACVVDAVPAWGCPGCPGCAVVQRRWEWFLVEEDRDEDEIRM